MFCGHCGTRNVEGNRFCVACGQAQQPAAASEPVPVPVPVLVLEQPPITTQEPTKTQAVQSPPLTDQTVSASAPVTPAAVTPSYCRHSPSERTNFGVDREHGSETCLGCALPYWPGSPNSLLAPFDQARGSAPQYQGFPPPHASGRQPPPQQGPQAGPGWNPPPQPTSPSSFGRPTPSPTTDSIGLCIGAMVMGCIALFFFPIVFGPIGIALASAALVRKERWAVAGMSVAAGGTVMGMVLGALVWSSSGMS